MPVMFLPGTAGQPMPSLFHPARRSGHFPHRAAAAFRAISRRCAGVSAAARAAPPAFPAFALIADICSGERVLARALPPFRPRATACGFFLAIVLSIAVHRHTMISPFVSFYA